MATRSGAPPAIEVGRRLRAANRRVASTLASIAVVFFGGIIATRWMGGGTIGIGVMGTAVLLFLVVAIGRNLRGAGERAAEGAGSTRPAALDTEGVNSQRHDAPEAADEAQR